MAKDKIKVEKPKTRKKVSGYGLLGTKYKKNPKYRDKPRQKRVDIREMNEATLDPFEQALKEIEREYGIDLSEGFDDEMEPENDFERFDRNRKRGEEIDDFMSARDEDDLGPNPLDLDDELQGEDIPDEERFGTEAHRKSTLAAYHRLKDTQGAEEEELDPHAMSNDQMQELVGYVHDDLLGGQPADPRDVENAFHQALDDVPGFEMGGRDDVMGRLVSLYNQLYGRERM